jgi:hypothetical protein
VACKNRKREQPAISECFSKATAGWSLYAEVQGYDWCDHGKSKRAGVQGWAHDQERGQIKGGESSRGNSGRLDGHRARQAPQPHASEGKAPASRRQTKSNAGGLTLQGENHTRRLNALPAEDETKAAREKMYRLVASRHAVQAVGASRG